jgi:hypothetical protein
MREEANSSEERQHVLESILAREGNRQQEAREASQE